MMATDSNTPLIARQSPAIDHSIRPVDLQDLDNLHKTCWSHRSITRCEDYLKNITLSMRSKRGLGIVVVHEASEKIIAYGQILRLSKCLEISDLLVLEDYRSQGIGTAMIQYLIRAMQPATLPVEIGAAQTNPRALALYKKLGFVAVYELELNLSNGKEQVIYLRLPEQT